MRENLERVELVCQSFLIARCARPGGVIIIVIGDRAVGGGWQTGLLAPT